MAPNATERKTLLVCGVIGGFVCSAPGEVISAFMVWGLTLVGYVVHRWLVSREEAAGRDPTRRGVVVRG